MSDAEEFVQVRLMTIESRLTIFFYLLMRDHLTVGDVNKLLKKAKTIKKAYEFTDKELEALAQSKTDEIMDVS